MINFGGTSVLAVANEVIKLANEKGKPIDNLRLQKIVYMIQGYSLALFNKPMFKEDLLAWTYGPVVFELYDAVKKKEASEGSRKIKTLIDTDEEITDESKIRLIKTIYGALSDANVWKLVKATHKEGSPWWETRRRGKEVIKLRLVEKYFSRLITTTEQKLKHESGNNE